MWVVAGCGREWRRRSACVRAAQCDESRFPVRGAGLDCWLWGETMRRQITCAYCKRWPRYKAGLVYLCTYHARYKRPHGQLPQRIA